MDNNTKQVVQDVMERYGNLGYLSSRSLFGGFGIILDEIMFAWVYEGQLYLRGHANYLDTYKQLAMQPLTLNSGFTQKHLQYYAVTTEIWQNRSLMDQLIDLSIEGAVKDKHKKLYLRENRLRDLPNITHSIERLLYSIGLTNVEQLQQSDVINIFELLKQRHNKLSINILYLLAAAIKGVHVACLSEQEKAALAQQYQQRLKEQKLHAKR